MPLFLARGRQGQQCRRSIRCVWKKGLHVRPDRPPLFLSCCTPVKDKCGRCIYDMGLPMYDLGSIYDTFESLGGNLGYHSSKVVHSSTLDLHHLGTIFLFAGPPLYPKIKNSCGAAL